MIKCVAWLWKCPQISFSQPRMWMSPLFPRLPKESSASAGESPTFFKRDLLEYLASYRAPELEEWIQRIKEHDLSETRYTQDALLYFVVVTSGYLSYWCLFTNSKQSGVFLLWPLAPTRLFFQTASHWIFFFIFGSFSIKLKDMAVRENPSRAAVCEINEMKWLRV